jgi:hypothetical protein
MFKFKIKADTGESHELTASSRDIVNWEKTTRGASMNQLKDAMRYTDLYKIAYFAAKRSGVWDGNEQSFVETYDLEVDAEQDDESQDPTQ